MYLLHSLKTLQTHLEGWNTTYCDLDVVLKSLTTKDTENFFAQMPMENSPEVLRFAQLFPKVVVTDLLCRNSFLPFIYWPLLHTGLYYILASTTYWPLLHTGLYYILASTTYWPLLHTGLYYILASTTYWPLLHTGLYYILASTTYWPLLHTGLYYILASTT